MSGEKRQENRRRIGIMGGTFDPIHIGHLILGENAYQQFELEKVLFMPSGNPPHKADREGASNEERVEMVKRAIASNRHFELSLEEMHDQGYNYTRETLERLTAANPDTDYYFILGADSLFSIEQWKFFREIFPTCTILAAMRDDKDAEEMKRQIRYLENTYNARIKLLQAPLVEISSTTIRNRIAENRSVRYMIPDIVERYIKEHNLYRGQ